MALQGPRSSPSAPNQNVHRDLNGGRRYCATLSLNSSPLPLHRLGGGPVTASSKSKFLASSPALPCPICGRNDKGGDCRISDDLVLCHNGTTFSPPALKSGQTTIGGDGQKWAYTKETGDGRCGTYTLHKPLQGTSRTITTSRASSQPIKLALLPAGAENVVAMGQVFPPSGVIYDYSPFHRVQRTKEKQFYSHHRLSEDAPYEPGKGEVPWPVYNQDAVIEYGPFNWALELEGEKCCDIGTSWGIVTFSQPGNKALLNPDLLQQRYACLLGAGVAGVVFIEDNDEIGAAKGKAALAAANAAGLPMVALKAAEVWAGIPAKGSIDDLPAGTQGGEVIAAIETAANAALAKQEKPEKPAAAKEDADTSTAKAIAALLEKLLDATLAEDQPLVDALKSRAWGYQLTRELLQERLLALWARRKGLLDGAKAPARSRMIGRADPGPGLQQLQPGFLLANDLHVCAADAGSGKTLMTLELATCLSIGAGFLDQQEGQRKGKGKVLFIASDGGASAWAMLNDYCDTLQSAERGAELEVWAEDPEEREASWNVSLPNLERLAQRMAEGDLLAVVIDTANACFQGAGISPYTGPVDQYLRLLKAIVCPTAALWINCHTTRSGQGMKAIGGHPAWQEVPSAVHRIERLKKEEGEAPVYKWTVEKFRGESPRSFNYHRLDGEFQLVGGAPFHEDIGDLLLRTIDSQQKAGLLTRPSALSEATKKSSASVWCALTRLRQQRLIRSQGTGNRLTPAGLERLTLKLAPMNSPSQDLDSIF